MKYSEAGKGSAPRKTQNTETYAKNWELIFGKKNGNDQNSSEETTQSLRSADDETQSGSPSL